jgi:hypothetical protein
MSCFTGVGGGVLKCCSISWLLPSRADKILYKGDVHRFVLNESEFREYMVSEIRIVLRGIN